MKHLLVEGLIRLLVTLPGGRKSGIPVLLYHRVCAPDKGFASVTPEEFRLQISALVRHGFTTVDLDAVAGYVRGEQVNLPSKPICITFDDAYLDTYLTALPVLEEAGFTATVFLPTAYVGRTTAISVGPKGWIPGGNGPRYSFMTEEFLRDAGKRGLRVEAHSHRHLLLSANSEDSVRADLMECRQQFRRIMGYEARVLAYPFGAYNDMVCRVAREVGFDTGVAVRPGVNRPGEDVFVLKRAGISGSFSEPRLLLYTTDRLHTFAAIRRALGVVK